MRRILVVDDDPHIGLAIRAWLKRYGFKVTVADGGTAGLIALNNSTFDLMIVDIFMPDMRGLESIRVFHNHAPTVPLIAISGYAFSSPQVSSPDFLRMALKLGATRCLRKPFRPHHIARRDRRMPVGGRTSPQICRDSGRSRERSVSATG
jgi:CheY-like chemotaxis protein